MDKSVSIYDPLDRDGNEIRLIKILPSKSCLAEGRTIDKIQCYMHKVSWESLPKYNAVSYMWNYFEGNILEPLDSDQGKMRILLNGQVKLITYNLWAALVSFRIDMESRRPQVPGIFTCLFWIDALCIDQDNVPERNSQVLRMAEIYKRAASVLVWLGPEKEQSNLAMDLATHPTRPSIKVKGDESILEEEIEWIETSIGKKELESHWRALIALYQRPYWNRIWIVQELLSNPTVWVYCGSSIAKFNLFIYLGIRIFRCIFLRDTPMPPVRLQTDLAVEVANSAPRIHFLIDQFTAGKNTDFSGHSLGHLLFRYGFNECTDPLDKVYALLGISTSSIDPSKFIDYKAPVSYIYALAVEIIVRDSGNLDDILQYVCYSDRSAFNLPTWVPSWRRNLTKILPLAEKHDGGHGPLRACGDQTANPAFLNCYKIMTTEGLHLGKIDDTSEFNSYAGYSDPSSVLLFDEDPTLLIENVISMFSKWLNFILSDYDKNPETVEVFAAYVTGEVDTDKIRILYELLFTTRRSKGSDTVDISMEHFLDFCKDVLRSSKTEDLDEILVEKVFDAGLVLNLCDRSLFRTKLSIANGKEEIAYGVCVTSGKHNDLLVIPQGCKFPVLLREDDKEPGFYTICTFIGLAYLSGYMYGEAVSKFDTQTYRIR